MHSRIPSLDPRYLPLQVLEKVLSGDERVPIEHVYIHLDINHGQGITTYEVGRRRSDSRLGLILLHLLQPGEPVKRPGSQIFPCPWVRVKQIRPLLSVEALCVEIFHAMIAGAIFAVAVVPVRISRRRAEIFLHASLPHSSHPTLNGGGADEGRLGLDIFNIFAHCDSLSHHGSIGGHEPRNAALGIHLLTGRTSVLQCG
mmetsp:Transcript_75159/g.195842  ORF Transcript_75159/g.195842 Transcript_75159/m.195842 type:complete len:200 (-) Transcript_75159:191-790(-)